VGEQMRSNIHLAGVDLAAFVRLTEARDRTLPMPKLMLPAPHEACRYTRRHGSTTPTSGRKRCSVANGERVAITGVSMCNKMRQPDYTDLISLSCGRGACALAVLRLSTSSSSFPRKLHRHVAQLGTAGHPLITHPVVEYGGQAA
jgi:hypothetical protein